MAGILAIEADRKRQTLLWELIRQHVRTNVKMVDTVQAAIANFSRYQPDLIIAPTLLSPADSEQLAAHMKAHAGPHVQMLTISALDVLRDSPPEEGRRLGLFRRRPTSLGLQYDPGMVGKEIADALERARILRLEHESLARYAKPLVHQHIVPSVQPTLSAEPGMAGVQPTDRRVAHRLLPESPGLWTVRTPWGSGVELVNISRTGVLLESGSKVTPGVTMELEVSGLGQQRVVMARFVRSGIARVDRLGVRYHAAAQFERPLDILPAHRAPMLRSMSESLGELLTTVLSDKDMPEAASVRFARGLRELLRARDVLIRRVPIVPDNDCESVYFGLREDGNSRTILQVIFDRQRQLTAAEFRVMKASAGLTAGVLELEQLAAENQLPEAAPEAILEVA